MTARREAVLLLGSNQGRRVRRIRDAVDRLSRETELLAVSRMYASEPFGRSHQPWFLNLAVRAAVSQTPWELLGLGKRLEREAGRRGGARWGPRTLDVDILLLGDAVIDSADLVVPHASMAQRRFCLLLEALHQREQSPRGSPCRRADRQVEEPRLTGPPERFAGVYPGDREQFGFAGEPGHRVADPPDAPPLVASEEENRLATPMARRHGW